MDDPRNIFVNQRQNYGQNQQNNEQTSSQNQQNNTQSAQQSNGQNQSYEQRVAEMKELAKKYQREGEGQLVKDIINNVIEQKAKGQLSNDQLLAFAKRIYPLLNAEQRQRLDELVQHLLKL